MLIWEWLWHCDTMWQNVLSCYSFNAMSHCSTPEKRSASKRRRQRSKSSKSLIRRKPCKHNILYVYLSLKQTTPVYTFEADHTCIYLSKQTIPVPLAGFCLATRDSFSSPILVTRVRESLDGAQSLPNSKLARGVGMKLISWWQTLGIRTWLYYCQCRV